MINLSEIASATEERVLTNMKASQTLVLDGLKRGVALADRVVPESVGDRIEEQVSNLPSASPLVDGAFDFAAKLLDAQREFMSELVAIVQPASVPAPASKPAAKKATTTKSTAKKSTAKKSTARKTAKKAA